MQLNNPPPHTHTHPLELYQKKHLPTHTHDEEGFAQTTRCALSQRGLLDPIKPAYKQSQSDGQLILTASAFNRLWINVLAVLVTVPTVTQNLLVPLSTSSITARHILDFMAQGNMTEAEAPTVCLDATPSRLSVSPPPSSPHL